MGDAAQKKRDSGQQRKRAAANTAIFECSRDRQIDELSQALLREYMHRKGFVETLRKFDDQQPRTEYTISSRALMNKMMCLDQIASGNAARSATKATIMEQICEHRLSMKKVLMELEEEEKAVAALEEEAERVAQEREKQKEEAAKEKKEKKKKKEKEKEGGEKKKDVEKKKKDKEKKSKRSASAPPGGTGGDVGAKPRLWQPPGLETSGGADPIADMSIGVGYKASKNLGFGGRDWKPPAKAVDDTSNWSSELGRKNDLKDARAMVEEEYATGRMAHDKMMMDLRLGSPATPSLSLDRDALRIAPTSSSDSVLSPTSAIKSPDGKKENKRVSFANA